MADNDVIAENEKWRKERHERLLDPKGWLTLAGLLWLEAGENTIGEGKDNKVQFETHCGADKLGSHSVVDGKVTYTPAPGVAVQHLDKDITETITMVTDAENEDNPTTLTHKSLSWFIIKRGDNYGIRLKDSESKVLKEFKGVEYFPINPAYRVVAKFVPFDLPRSVKVPTALGIEDGTALGQFEFEVNGSKQVLTTTGKPNERNMLVFADQTTNKTTYGGGRFVWTDAVGDDNCTVIDFNKAYNPPCIFTPFATCPRPLPENKLSVAVEAGEKTWGDH